MRVLTVMMRLFYRSFLESILTACIIAWYANLTLTTKNWLGSLVKSCEQDLTVLYSATNLLAFATKNFAVRP